MQTLRPELIKLKRSQSWIIVVLLPVIMAGAGTVNTVVSGAELDDGWHTLWLRTVVFFGLFPLPLGVAILASLSWRADHRDGNWNALMAGTATSGSIVRAKTAVIAGLAALMQLVVLATVLVLGKLVFGLPGMLPADLLGVSMLIMLGCIPLAALQSWLSMRTRSFAAPIAVALVGAGISVLLLNAKLTGAIFVLPYALAARSTQLSTGTFGDSGTLTLGAVGAVLAATAVLTVVVVAVAGRSLDRRDVAA